MPDDDSRINKPMTVNAVVAPGVGARVGTGIFALTGEVVAIRAGRIAGRCMC